MKNITLLLILLLSANLNLKAQETNNQSISNSLGLYAFPKENQDKEKIEADEYSCYKWAMEQSNYNPMNPDKVEAEVVDRSADGTAVVGAAKGAAAGAAIGAIAGDAGKGAAIGAATGGLAGRRAKKYGDHKKQENNNAEADAYNKEQLENFKKAYSACMEAKGYSIK